MIYNPFKFRIFKVKDWDSEFYVVKRKHWVFWWVDIYAAHNARGWNEEINPTSLCKFKSIESVQFLLEKINFRIKMERLV